MTSKDFYVKYKSACIKAFKELKGYYYVPHDTGNLKYNALKYEFIGTKFHMWVDEEIAPYMVFTNEKWIAERWKGAQNPNEGWWNYACEWFFERITQLLNGELKKR